MQTKLPQILLTLKCVTVLMLLPSVKVLAQTLEVGVLITTGEQRALYTTVAQDFEIANPGTTVKLIARNDAEYKASLKDWLNSNKGPDVLNWQGGERLYQYVRSNRIADISDLWQKHDLESKFSQGAISAVSMDGSRYAIPISYYQWGFFYRKSLFKKYSLRPPTTWDEFLYVCDVLKSKGVQPITIGNKNNWPSAAWFDYFNLRINGLQYHQDLLLGKNSFQDAEVREVFEHWKILVDRNYYVDKQNKWSWNEAMPFLYHKMAGMTLMGNFFAGQLPEIIKDDFGFFRFPIIKEDLPIYEEAPLDLFMIPRYSKNRALARKFLLALAARSFQEQFNEAQGMISPNITSRASNDYFIREGTEVLNQAEGLSQFFDRDTNSQMANSSIKVFTEFMQSGNIGKTVRQLESAREKYLTEY